MPRLFLGIDIPESTAQRLFLMQGGVPGARWEQPEKFHLTLRFLGDLDHGTMRRLQDRMTEIDHDPFELELAGVGFFPPRGKPRSLWVGVSDATELRALKGKIDQALDSLDLDRDPRKFAPHLTLARLRDAPQAKVMEYLARYGTFRAEPFVVDRFKLFSSVRSERGSKYRVEAAFRLDDPLHVGSLS